MAVKDAGQFDVPTQQRYAMFDGLCVWQCAENSHAVIGLDPLIPKPGIEHPYGIEKLSKASHAFGTITYSNGKRGLIVYLGTTLIPGLPADLYGYKLSHDDFPDEATSDQIFGEKQFEAYRELGAQLGQRMISSIDVNRHRIWPPQ